MRSSALRLSLCTAVFFSACKHEEPVHKPGPPTAPDSFSTQGVPRETGPITAKPDETPTTGAAATQEPIVELPPAPPIPPNPAFLPDITDPADNPTTPEKVVLGYMLFFDKRLSKDDSMACENCHHTDKAWTEGQALSAKVGGAMNTRNAPTVLNIGYHTSFYWDGRMPTLEAVCNAAWTGQLGAKPADVAAKLNANPTYRAQFTRAFGAPANDKNIPMAFASFLRALKSGDSPWDKFEKGDQKAVTKEAKRGFQVFRNAGCALCHVPPLYTDAQFHNVGVGYDKPEDKRDHGRIAFTKDPKTDGQFKTPSLRDVELTAPYFHDGSVATLDQAITFMVGGGKKNPNLDEKLKPKKLSAKDKAALKAFLVSLSGHQTFNGPPPELPK